MQKVPPLKSLLVDFGCILSPKHNKVQSSLIAVVCTYPGYCEGSGADSKHCLFFFFFLVAYKRE